MSSSKTNILYILASSLRLILLIAAISFIVREIPISLQAIYTAAATPQLLSFHERSLFFEPFYKYKQSSLLLPSDKPSLCFNILSSLKACLRFLSVGV